MAFNKDADWDQFQGQGNVVPGVEKTMRQGNVDHKNPGKKSLREGMHQGKTPRKFDLKSPNASMKQGKK